MPAIIGKDADKMMVVPGVDNKQDDVRVFKYKIVCYTDVFFELNFFSLIMVLMSFLSRMSSCDIFSALA